jgi:uncharacterized protein YegJ (DUF2314 family)
VAKLLAQIFVGVVAWYVTGEMNVSLVARLAALVVAAAAVHTVWQRLFPGPLYLGAPAFDNDDPLILAAVEEARRTLPFLRKVFPDHRQDTMVRYAFLSDSGTVEYLWGDLLELSETTAKVFTRTPPISHKGPFERTLVVPVEELSDWQIEYHDGSLRGGFTNQAMFKVYEREEGRPHPQMREQMARFRSIDELDVTAQQASQAAEADKTAR